MGVEALIREAIEDHGPITFAEFMELALYGPGGFYERAPVGAEGEFVTSPHVHHVFADLLAGAIRELWELLGRPEPFEIAEAGAGDGTLARRLEEALADVQLAYTAIERSPEAREALRAVEGLAVSESLPRGAHVVLANELLDNLPFRIVRGTAEVRVGFEDARFVEVPTPLDDELLVRASGLGREEERIVPAGALGFVEALSRTLAGGSGYALLIDYGGVGSPGGEVHGYRAHRVVEDVLEDPGSADITSGVDFAVVTARAAELGLEVFPTATQRRALLALGFEQWARSELDRQRRLPDEGAGLDAVRAWGGRSRATLLVDPAALGRLRWLLLATPGLPQPAWLGRALENRPPAD